jgi:hypothetical protein
VVDERADSFLCGFLKEFGLGSLVYPVALGSPSVDGIERHPDPSGDVGLGVSASKEFFGGLFLRSLFIHEK